MADVKLQTFDETAEQSRVKTDSDGLDLGQSYILSEELSSDPTTPASGHVVIYCKAGDWFQKDDTGTVKSLNNPGLENLSEDTSPSLGANLNANGNSITGLADFESTGKVKTTSYIEISDITAPSHAGAGIGRLFKKTGDDGVWWKPDAAGAEVDLTASSTGTELDDIVNTVAVVSPDPSIVAGDCLMKTSLGVDVANSSDSNSVQFAGFSTGASGGGFVEVKNLDGQEVDIDTSQIEEGGTITVGAPYFMSRTSRKITAAPNIITVGNNVVQVGVGTTTTKITIQFSYRATVGSDTPSNPAATATDGSILKTTSAALTPGQACTYDVNGKVKPYSSGFKQGYHSITVSNTGGSGGGDHGIFNLDATRFLAWSQARHGSYEGSLAIISWHGSDASIAPFEGTNISNAVPGIEQSNKEMAFAVGSNRAVVIGCYTNGGGRDITMSVYDVSSTVSPYPITLLNQATLVSGTSTTNFEGIAFAQDQEDRFCIVYTDNTAATTMKTAIGHISTHATETLTVIDYTGLTTDNFVLDAAGDADTLLEGTDFSAVTSNSTTATNIATAINTEFPTKYHAAASGDDILVTALDHVAANGNAYTVTSSDAVNLTTSGGFSGGSDGAATISPTVSFTTSHFGDDPIRVMSFKTGDPNNFGIATREYDANGLSSGYTTRALSPNGFQDTPSLGAGPDQETSFPSTATIYNVTGYVVGAMSQPVSVRNGLANVVVSVDRQASRGAIYLNEFSTSDDWAFNSTTPPEMHVPVKIALGGKYVAASPNVSAIDDSTLAIQYYGPHNASVNQSEAELRTLCAFAKKSTLGDWVMQPATDIRDSWFYNGDPDGRTKFIKLTDTVLAGIAQNGAGASVFLIEVEMDFDFAGVSGGTYADGEVAKIFPEGTLATGLSGKTRGENQYLDKEGLTQGLENNISAGTAVSATSIRVKPMRLFGGKSL